MSAPATARPRVDFSRGFYINEKGYARITVLPHRGKYVHRVVMAIMLADTDTAILAALGIAASAPATIPPKFTVEHLDHRRTHNCPENLLLLDKRLHDAISWASMCRYSQRFVPKPDETDQPDWVGEVAALTEEFAVLEVCE